MYIFVCEVIFYNFVSEGIKTSLIERRVAMYMKSVDDVLELLEDGEWHSLEKVMQQLKLDDFKAGIIFDFLAEYGFIEIDEKGIKGKLVPSFQTFLREIKILEV